MTEEESRAARRQEITDDLTSWWMKQAEREISIVVPKAVEYGSADLEVMGRAMEMLIIPDTNNPLSDKGRRRMGMEMAVAFYALGKVARLFGAYERGDFPSDDTWHDLGVYCRMAQRIREVGQWV